MLAVDYKSIVSDSKLKTTVWKYLGIILITFLLARVFQGFWAERTDVWHTVSELVCIFIALSSFFVVWHTHDDLTHLGNIVLAYGFLSVAIYDMFHIYYFHSLNNYPSGYFDLSARYWVMGRLSEALVLLLCTFNILKKKISKRLLIIITLLCTVGVSYLILSFPWLMPVLFTPEGVTPAKMWIESFIIVLFLIDAYMIVSRRLNSSHGNFIAFEYILLSIFTAVPAELCFMLFKDTSSFLSAFGHFLKVVYYFFLFKGIFSSAILYPYKKIRESHSLTENMLNKFPIGQTLYDRSGNLVFANNKILDILGCSLEDIKGLNVRDVVKRFIRPEEFLNDVSSNITNDSLPVYKSNVRTIINSRDQEIKMKIDAYRLEDGGYMYLFSEAGKEQELENLQLQTQMILDSMNNNIIIIDKNNRIVKCNKTFINALGIEFNEFAGMDIKDFREKIQYRESPALHEEDNSSTYEATFISSKGEKKEVIVNSSSIYNVYGEFIGIVNIGSDITALKSEQQKLQQQERLALIGQMASGIVHEIKNPLTAIEGFCQIIRQKYDDKKLLEYMGYINDAAGEVNRFISNILDLAKPHPAVFREISLNQLIKNIELILKDYLYIQKINFNVTLGCQDKAVIADENKIKQVILNIVRNATDALVDTIDPQLSIVTDYNSVDNEMIIKIIDNGKGISAEDKKRIGTPFFTTKKNGTGLGLSICYQIMDEHKGKIDIESQEGAGTSFTICFPCKDNLST